MRETGADRTTDEDAEDEDEDAEDEDRTHTLTVRPFAPSSLSPPSSLSFTTLFPFLAIPPSLAVPPSCLSPSSLSLYVCSRFSRRNEADRSPSMALDSWSSTR